MKKIYFVCIAFIFAAFVLYAENIAAKTSRSNDVEQLVTATIVPLMKEQNIPGMAVAVTLDGKNYIFNFGVASQEHGTKVTKDTIFEIGSVSKTFTATLACYAQATGVLSLADRVSQHLPELAGSQFENITLLELGTYTAGGLPLQFPDSVVNLQTMIAYYKNWRASYAPGTHRLYSNSSIGLLGHLVARRMEKPFDTLMEQMLFPKLGLAHTFINVPQSHMKNYAWGYTKDGTATRVTPGVLDAEAYGVKTTASDLLHVVTVNMNSTEGEDTLQQALAATRNGYFKVGDMMQGLGWEIYPYPIAADKLIAGNAPTMLMEPHEATRLTPPVTAQHTVLLNKTGTTSGFGAYVAFVPAKKMGIVMLANKNYPNTARVKAAYHLLTAFEHRVNRP